MSAALPPLELTFAGMVGRMRVVDRDGQTGVSWQRRFAVMFVPINFPEDKLDEERMLCSVSSLPIAQAIAALPEMVAALGPFAAHEPEYLDEPGVEDEFEPEAEAAFTVGDYRRLRAAKAKAEGRAA